MPNRGATSLGGGGDRRGKVFAEDTVHVGDYYLDRAVRSGSVFLGEFGP